MDGHGLVTVVACAGHLAFGTLIFMRRPRSPLADLMAWLFLDAFAWNFASLAYDLSGVELWSRVDRFFASLMPAIALHVVIVFVGRARRLRPLVLVAYPLFGVLGVLGLAEWWWKAVIVLGPGAMAFALALLLVHRRQALDPEERGRTDLLFLALGIGTLLSATDLLYGESSFPIPRLGAIGTLTSTGLIAVAALRLRLFGRELPPVLAVYTLLFAVFWVVAQLAFMRWLAPETGPWVLGAVALTLVGVATARELGRSAALSRARGQELQTLGRFSQQLAHDLRNPLAALKGAVEFLGEERRSGRSVDGQQQFFGLMLEQIERAERIVHHYERMAKVQPNVAPTPLSTLVHHALPILRFGVVPGVTIEERLAADLPSCALDPDLVVTALENVIRNACEAMPQGGLIRVETHYDRDLGQVSLDVGDDGEGMSPMVLERATALFFTTKAQGTGLGLSFAERVARAHGGVLRVASTLGRGTTVSLVFPASAEAGAS